MTTLAHLPRPAAGRSTLPARRASRIALWVLQGALAMALFAAGASKLTGAESMVQLFDAIGVGQWFRYVTGSLEIAGAIMLLVPAVAALGAVLLAGVMTGAVISHFAVLHSSPAAPLGLLAGLAVVAYARRAEILAQLARLFR